MRRKGWKKDLWKDDGRTTWSVLQLSCTIVPQGSQRKESLLGWRDASAGSFVVIWLDVESWAPKNWCFWTVVLEKTLESPLECKEIQPVHSEGDQPWDFFGRNYTKAETSTLATSCKELTHWKRVWCWEGLGAGGEGVTEHKMVGWHHRLNEHGFG